MTKTKQSPKELTKNPFALEEGYYLPISAQRASYIVRTLGLKLPSPAYERSLGLGLWLTTTCGNYELRRYSKETK